MRILVLGNSDTAGMYTDAETWPAVVAARLAARGPQDVTVVERPFWALNPRAPTIAVERAQETGADLVVLPLGSFAFTVGFVWVRVRRLFGERAARRFRAAEASFDNRTRRRNGIRASANRLSRGVARSLIGIEAPHSVEETAAAYVAVLRALSRVETLDVLVVESRRSAGGRGGRRHRGPAAALPGGRAPPRPRRIATRSSPTPRPSETAARS
ncbi:MAG: hypothetical protein IPG47_10095 [Thermoflexaceae bacterium]|nr:hypothetical protein [Thermoflexaceae bacterium]